MAPVDEAPPVDEADDATTETSDLSADPVLEPFAVLGVTTTADTVDATPGDGTCADADGACSLALPYRRPTPSPGPTPSPSTPPPTPSR